MALSRRDIDQIIEDVTIDCYNDDEERTAFIVAFDEHLGRAPVLASIAGFKTTLTGVDDGGERRGVVAEIRHAGRTHAVSLFDVELSGAADPEMLALMVAYREWCRR